MVERSQPTQASSEVLPVIDPTYDSSFKYVFGTEGESEPILACLLNDVLHLEGDRAIKTLRYKSVERVIDRQGGRGLVLDLLVTDERGVSYDVEIQRSDSAPVITRSLYQGARLLAGQLNQRERYDDLKPVIVVFFCLYSTFPDHASVRTLRLSAYAIDREGEETPLGSKLSDFDPATHKRYDQLKNKVRRAEASLSLLRLYLVELDKPNPKLSDRQRAWLTFLLNGEPREGGGKPKPMRDHDTAEESEMYTVVDGYYVPNNAPPETIDWINAARERLKRFAADPSARRQYDRENLERLSHNTSLHYAIEEGLERGRAEGEAKGRAEMISKMIPQLRASGFDDAQIKEMLALHDDEAEGFFKV